jgi:hemerythrin superfamily protein
MLEQLKGVLTVHNATEENIVYPAIDKLARDENESKHLYHETAEADVALFELDNLLKDGHEASFIAKAEKFREAVLHHIENEEGSAFPHLRENTDAKQSKTLTESVRTFRESLHFEP